MRLASQGQGSRPRPRGLTLVEMLVVVALVVLIMTVLTSIFAAATGAITTSRSLQELDQRLRRLDGTLRADLAGVTARLNPVRPDGRFGLDPKDNLGYFEYGENAFADAQGEDTDDYLAFTAQAPPGQPFVGRIAATVFSNPLSYQMISVTSQYAEITYFLRAGNLYRRVLLIAPERQHSILAAPPNVLGAFVDQGSVISWQGANDLSAHPGPHNAPSGAPTLNTLGDLTNRENRFARPRFANDFVLNGSGSKWIIPPDGLPDDQNNDGVPDFWPTLYPGVFAAKNPYYARLVANPSNYPAVYLTPDVMAFPYVYPHAYSASGADPTTAALGPIHSVDASNQTHNHAPLEFGDSLPVPVAANYQSWWGFPTWKETMAFRWSDPVWQVNGHTSQSPGLTTSATNATAPVPLRTRLDAAGSGNPKFMPLPFSDGAGSTYYGAAGKSAFDYYWAPFPSLKTLDPDIFWEDDLILTGVRSFDVKAYDPNPMTFDPSTGAVTHMGSGYFDLGYEGFYHPNNLNAVNQTPPVMLATFGHEGRIPPLSADHRPDAQFPQWLGNIGDDNLGVLRLRRVFDTWSTAYSETPSTPSNPLAGPPFGPPSYPSYPPPYPAPLRGIQIQIRVTDPASERVKVLTLRQDFSDKQ
jgi:prepilin-type N-terminal cleavage/methylation domain-containing protein